MVDDEIVDHEMVDEMVDHEMVDGETDDEMVNLTLGSSILEVESNQRRADEIMKS